MATHSSIFAWRSNEWENLVGWSPRGCKELDPIDAAEHTRTRTHQAAQHTPLELSSGKGTSKVTLGEQRSADSTATARGAGAA